ncbi:MAG: hypothetical protein ACLFV8_13215, partial [Alphaproteobacteria bacterium]
LAFVPPPPGPGPHTAGRGATAPPLGENGEMEKAVPKDAADGPAFRRPIFVPSRRLQGGGPGGVEGLKLRAVFMGPGTKKALVEIAPARETLWVTPGQEIAGWQVEEIHAEHVILSRRDGRRTLELEKPEEASGRARTSSRHRGRNTADTEKVRTSKQPE